MDNSSFHAHLICITPTQAYAVDTGICKKKPPESGDFFSNILPDIGFFHIGVQITVRSSLVFIADGFLRATMVATEADDTPVRKGDLTIFE